MIICSIAKIFVFPQSYEKIVIICLENLLFLCLYCPFEFYLKKCREKFVSVEKIT